MAKAERILDLFPAFYAAGEPGKLLRHVVAALAQPLEEADSHLFRIQRAHRLRVTEHAADILRLAAALNLTPFHFEDILADDTQDEDSRLSRMRERVERIARLHLLGLGTPWAVVEAAAIFLDAAVVPERPGDPLLKRLDAEALSHKATVAFPQQPERPRDRIYLHEHLLRRRKVDPAERWPRNGWALTNADVEAAPATFLIRGVADRTVRPSLWCPRTGEGLLFDGIVPGASTLLIEATGGASLDGRPVDDWLISFAGGIFDAGVWDDARYLSGADHPPAPFDGDLAALVTSPTRRRQAVPRVPPGRSEWSFTVAEGLYDAAAFDYAVFATPAEPIGVYDGTVAFDRCVFDYPPSAVTGMAWDERIPCAFKLLLPPARVDRPAATNAGAGTAAPGGDRGRPPDAVGRVAGILPRFKPAGVRAYVDVAPDAWILGEGVLRTATAVDGEGIDERTTRLRHPRADLLIPLDTTPAT